ncbi:His-Xaa-Ser system radical SAM maturase HxsB [Tistrella bauzanensis]|uniref:His-Xaa-Ser system radical SAM maturase HxsB n=1 Tax=Tistrella arctica TaxID=3133430 RepID=A0ABU9YDT0_9PROT
MTVVGLEPSLRLMPFRFERLAEPPGQVLLTQDGGDFIMLDTLAFTQVITSPDGLESGLRDDLLARGFLCHDGDQTAARITAAQLATRKRFIGEGPSLHICVVTLRCDHACTYCQVSRRGPSAAGFDMSEITARAAVRRIFESRAPALTIEFQGGEPALAFDRVRQITSDARARAKADGRIVQFSMVSTLQRLDDDMLGFCRDHEIALSTSIDGPAALHDRHRQRPAGGAFEATLQALDRARKFVGADGIAAIATITGDSINHPEEVVDTYVEAGFRSIFVRPVAPYGFARRHAGLAPSTQDFIAFYRRALDRCIAHSLAGRPIEEAYAAILLTHILTPFGGNYVDLRSPAGAGLGVLVYDHDGGVYVSDEARMLAATGDRRLRIGDVGMCMDQLMESQTIPALLASGLAESLPGCWSCAFQPYCGNDPVHHLATCGDPVGHRAFSDHCARHKALFKMLFAHIAAGDPAINRVFSSWIGRQTLADISGTVRLD